MGSCDKENISKIRKTALRHSSTNNDSTVLGRCVATQNGITDLWLVLTNYNRCSTSFKGFPYPQHFVDLTGRGKQLDGRSSKMIKHLVVPYLWALLNAPIPILNSVIQVWSCQASAMYGGVYMVNSVILAACVSLCSKPVAKDLRIFSKSPWHLF